MYVLHLQSTSIQTNRISSVQQPHMAGGHGLETIDTDNMCHEIASKKGKINGRRGGNGKKLDI